MLPDGFTFPPASPENEQPAPDDPEYAAAQRADWETHYKWPIRWGDELFTYSETWGRIWRADMWDPHRPRQRYPTRMICWTRPDGGPSTYICTYEPAIRPLKP